jgi:FKBP-type peptidyl-prolyl cis-trans isomerase FkpA
MLRNLIAFSLLLIIALSCTKTETPVFVDYGPIDKKIIEDYLKAHNNSTAQSTATGLYYIIHSPGGNIHPTTRSVVSVNYDGYLTNNTHFGTSTPGTPYTRSLSELIAGWQEGLKLIGAGGKITLYCPSNLGYGGTTNGTIPAHSVLIFDIELVSFK